MPFGITSDELVLARAAALIAFPHYGDMQGEELVRFMANPWNDHISVQAAIEAIKLLKHKHGIR